MQVPVGPLSWGILSNKVAPKVSYEQNIEIALTRMLRRSIRKDPDHNKIYSKVIVFKSCKMVYSCTKALKFTGLKAQGNMLLVEIMWDCRQLANNRVSTSARNCLLEYNPTFK